MKLTFATWNILEGGGGDARLRRQMALLADLSPAAVALQECKNWDQDGYRALYLAEHLLGMRGFLAPSAHHRCHLAVFIRQDAGLRVTGQRHEHGTPYWHGIARIIVTAAGYPRPLQLASCHLAPTSPTIRLAETEALGLIASQHPGIIAGDWNALPARDPQPGHAEGRSRGKLDRRAALALEEAGFLDTGAHAHDLTPTVGHASELPYRCDRIYTTLPAPAITAYQVITTADTESDHRPVIAEFDLTRAAHHGQA
jgi:endonuclease/exonuclease/phosphatase family metal-dependent hydrolase